MTKDLFTQQVSDKEDFRLYYRHQYDRMKELEQQRLIMTNVIVTISVLSFSLAFADIDEINLVSGVGLPIVVIFANLIAIRWNQRTRAFIKMHQKRARAALDVIAPEVEALNRSIPKPFNSNRDIFRRAALQNYLHVLLIAVSVLPLLLCLRIL
ncbi:MAG: hypothetical protein AAF716_20695 [Cyanobacteria bacterium P01_D01_bin.1]